MRTGAWPMVGCCRATCCTSGRATIRRRACRRSIEVLDERESALRTVALFPEDRIDECALDTSVVRLRLSQLRLCHPRVWGSSWLALKLWERLELDRFWSQRLSRSRKGTRWAKLSSMKLGAAQSQSPSAWRLVEVNVDDAFTYALRRNKLREVRRRREGRCLLRTNLTSTDCAELWRYYIQLVQVEQAFKDLKGDLAVHPNYHQLEQRVEAHIFIAFLAYYLHVTLAQQLRPHARGLSPRSVLDKFAAVPIPTTDGRELVLTRHTEPERELTLLLERLNLELSAQPSPKITAPQANAATSM